MLNFRIITAIIFRIFMVHIRAGTGRDFVPGYPSPKYSLP